MPSTICSPMMDVKAQKPKQGIKNVNGLDVKDVNTLDVKDVIEVKTLLPQSSQIFA